MKAKHAPLPQNWEQMERDTLRLLCSIAVKPGTRMEICRLLKPHDFFDPLPRTVFEEILEAGPIESRQLRATLRARVAGRGFPDFNLKKLLALKLATDLEIQQTFESTLQLVKLGSLDFPSFPTPEANVQD